MYLGCQLGLLQSSPWTPTVRQSCWQGVSHITDVAGTGLGLAGDRGPRNHGIYVTVFDGMRNGDLCLVLMAQLPVHICPFTYLSIYPSNVAKRLLGAGLAGHWGQRIGFVMAWHGGLHL